MTLSAIRRSRGHGLRRHRLGDGLTHFLRCLDEVPVGEVSIARRGPVPSVAEQLPDQGAVEKVLVL